MQVDPVGHESIPAATVKPPVNRANVVANIVFALMGAAFIWYFFVRPTPVVAIRDESAQSGRFINGGNCEKPR